ncbi:MAG TPA: NTP transferase domain-containing protein [Lacisediminihabitans sp.]|nr:NTP transferase domain-containing protein [Lacisediminihabitans sp.]HXD60971.1 NTP transferase domain-containing protein [Lacisediminihabitans sp.]
MPIDALILAGGRSTRLDSIPKAALIYRGKTLLENTVSAVSEFRTVVVGTITTGSLPAGVLVCREDPPFGGPAAAVGAGLDALEAGTASGSDFTVVLACDMPGVADVVPPLLRALEGSTADGVITVDEQQRRQPLAAAYRTAPLRLAVQRQRHTASLGGLSMFQLIRELTLVELPMADRTTSDVDTWSDAADWGMEHPDARTAQHNTATQRSSSEH